MIITITHNSQSQQGLLFKPRQVNLHTHSVFCGHGKGSVNDYVESAVANEVRVLGCSEHAPVPDERWSRTRMPFSRIGEYMHDVEQAQADRRLTVLKAVECDYLGDYQNYYRDEFLGRRKCDYLIGAIHFVNFSDAKDISIHNGHIGKRELARYTEHYVDMLASGLFLFGAHPDVFGCMYRVWDDEAKACSQAIIQAAKTYNVPLEINGNGFRRNKILSSKGLVRPYPIRHFWEMACEAKVTAITNSDAHKPEDLTVSFDTSVAFANSIGIELASFELIE